VHDNVDIITSNHARGVMPEEKKEKLLSIMERINDIWI